MNPPAQDPFQALVSMQEKLVRENPKSTENTVVLGSLYSTQATLARDQGNTQNALVQFDKAIATLQAVVEKEPRHVKARELLRDSHSGRAETLVRLNRPAEALAEWDRALELDTWPSGNEFRLQRALALARLGEHAKATMECDTLARGKNLSAATLVTLARVYARSAGAVRAGQPKGTSLPAAERVKLGEHYAARAVAALVEVDAAGYFKMAGKLDELKTSTDFEPLRSREDFKSLMGRV
jgi:tetratricopeptide (TPR) repeat protein